MPGASSVSHAWPLLVLLFLLAQPICSYPSHHHHRAQPQLQVARAFGAPLAAWQRQL